MTQVSAEGAESSKSGSSASDVAKSKDRRERNAPPTKVVVRRLPPSMTLETFKEQVSPLPEHDYIYFVKGDMSLGQYAFARTYINFINQDDIFIFKDKFDGYVFVDQRGNEYPAVVEFAPFQKVPRRKNKKKDIKCGMIDSDPDYLKFLENLKNPVEVVLPSAEAYLEEIEARDRELNANNGFLKTTTPLIEYVLQRKAEKQRIREEKKEERKRKELEKKKMREEERRKRKEGKEREMKEKERRDKEKAEGKEQKKDVKEVTDKEEEMQPVVKILLQEHHHPLLKSKSHPLSQYTQGMLKSDCGCNGHAKHSEMTQFTADTENFTQSISYLWYNLEAQKKHNMEATQKLKELLKIGISNDSEKTGKEWFSNKTLPSVSLHPFLSEITHQSSSEVETNHPLSVTEEDKNTENIPDRSHGSELVPLKNGPDLRLVIENEIKRLLFGKDIDKSTHNYTSRNKLYVSGNYKYDIGSLSACVCKSLGPARLCQSSSTCKREVIKQDIRTPQSQSSGSTSLQPLKDVRKVKSFEMDSWTKKNSNKELVYPGVKILAFPRCADFRYKPKLDSKPHLTRDLNSDINKFTLSKAIADQRYKRRWKVINSVSQETSKLQLAYFAHIVSERFNTSHEVDAVVTVDAKPSSSRSSSKGWMDADTFFKMAASPGVWHFNEHVRKCMEELLCVGWNGDIGQLKSTLAPK